MLYSRISSLKLSQGSNSGLRLEAQDAAPVQIIVLEEKAEYTVMQSKKTLEALQRKPFEVIVICNPRLAPVGRKGFRYWEACLSVAGYQVPPRLLLAHPSQNCLSSVPFRQNDALHRCFTQATKSRDMNE
jgi:hypothetical protein